MKLIRHLPSSNSSSFEGRKGVLDRLILTLDVTGYPYAWMNWKQAVIHQATGRVSRKVGDYEFTFKGGLNRHTQRISTISINSIIALRGRNPMAWKSQTIALTNAALFNRDRYICAYCGKKGSKSELTRDHIIPVCQGGLDTWLNCTTACAACNHRKGGRTLEQSGMELHYVPYVPSIQEGLILENRKILADQMELLSTLLPKNSRLFLP